jgi:hypothetical protein
MTRVDELLAIGVEIDGFYSRYIQHVWDNANRAWFEFQFKDIQREYDRIVGYRRGFRDALMEYSNSPLLAEMDPPFVAQALIEVRQDLKDLARKCTQGASKGRTRRERIFGADLEISVRAQAIQAANPAGVKLRKAILLAIREREERTGERLPITTTLEGHIRRIRRCLDDGLLPPAV